GGGVSNDGTKPGGASLGLAQASACATGVVVVPKWKIPRTFSLLLLSLSLLLQNNSLGDLLPPQSPSSSARLQAALLNFCTKDRWALPDWARDIVLEVCTY